LDLSSTRGGCRKKGGHAQKRKPHKLAKGGGAFNSRRIKEVERSIGSGGSRARSQRNIRRNTGKSKSTVPGKL